MKVKLGIKDKNIKNVYLESCSVTNDSYNNKIYLTLNYIYKDNNDNVHRFSIPIIRLPFYDNMIPEINLNAPETYIFLNDNNLRLDSDDFIVEDYTGKVTKINDTHCVDVINHKNEDKQDNRVENLEWCTVRYNTLYGTGRIRTSMKQGRAVEQLDLDDNIVDEFYSMCLASKITGIPQPNIHKVCNSTRRTAGGYKWRYKDEY